MLAEIEILNPIVEVLETLTVENWSSKLTAHIFLFFEVRPFLLYFFHVF